MTDYNVLVPHYSVMLADGLQHIIQKNYSFKHRISMELLSSAMNDLYRVQSGEYTYTLRVPRHERYWPFTRESYEFELHLVNYLRSKELGVAYPIPTISKQFLGILNAPEGLRYYSLHTQTNGRRPDLDNRQDMKLLGNYLGRLHQLADGFQSQYKGMSWNFDLMIKHGLSRLEEVIPQGLKDDFNTIKSKATALIADFKEILPDAKDMVGVIHGAFRKENLGIDNGEVMAGNFEYCGKAYRILDFVYMLQKTNINNVNNKLFQAFLNGYKEILPLRDAEIEAIPLLCRLGLISRMTVSVGMINLVGILWFENKIRADFNLLKKIL